MRFLTDPYRSFQINFAQVLMDAIHVTNSRSSSFSPLPPQSLRKLDLSIRSSVPLFIASGNRKPFRYIQRKGDGMNSLNLQGIFWNFFARDRCVSVSITQSRLIARGHHQRRLILFRVGSIPPKNYLFFSLTPWNERASSHRSPLFVLSIIRLH